MKIMTFALTAMLIASGAQAQSISAADIAAMVDKKMGAVDEYAELLNDPDPDRSLAAMQIMIGVDDPQISRMALQFGLTSTSPAVRRAALKAFLDSAPNIGIYIDGSGLDLGNFTTNVTRAGGSVDANAVGYLTYQIGPYDAENNCYDYVTNASYCQVKLTEDAVSVQFWNKWSPFKLNAEGVLEGVVHVDRLVPAAPTRIPVRQ